MKRVGLCVVACCTWACALVSCGERSKSRKGALLTRRACAVKINTCRADLVSRMQKEALSRLKRRKPGSSPGSISEEVGVKMVNNLLDVVSMLPGGGLTERKWRTSGMGKLRSCFEKKRCVDFADCVAISYESHPELETRFALVLPVPGLSRPTPGSRIRPTLGSKVGNDIDPEALMVELLNRPKPDERQSDREERRRLEEAFPAELVVDGPLTKSLVNHAFYPQTEIVQCFRRSKKSRSSVIVIEFTVTTQGGMDGIKVIRDTSADPRVRRCVLPIARKARFPRREKATRVRFPFRDLSGPLPGWIPDADIYSSKARPGEIVFDGKGNRFPVNIILIRLRPGAGRKTAEEVARKVNGRVVGQLLSLGLYQIRVPTRTKVELGLLVIRAGGHPKVESAGYDLAPKPRKRRSSGTKR